MNAYTLLFPGFPAEYSDTPIPNRERRLRLRPVYRAPTREAPENVPTLRVQRVHLP